MFDVIVVGSGPAGVSATLALRPLKVLMLDVGFEGSGESLPDVNLRELRQQHDLTRPLIGEQFESLHNIERSYLSPKLKAPLMRFITETPPGEPGVFSNGFAAVRSYAKGGLANAWGAGVFRYDDHDLARFPIDAADLTPFYDELTRHIGVSGAKDDLAKFFGSSEGLQPPLPLSRIATRFLQGYQRHRELFERQGIHVGRLRSAILTQPHRGREPHRALNHEFFQPNIPSLYHPGYTLDEMRAAGEVSYQQGQRVVRYREHDDWVEVSARDLRTGDTVTHAARQLVLAAGAINSAGIVLASHDDFTTELPILDNLLSYIPLLDLRRIGYAPESDAFTGAELCMVYDGPLADERIQASFYGLDAPLRGDLFFEMPLTLRGNLAAVKYLLPSLGMLQLFYPDRPRSDNYLKLRSDGALAIQYEARSFGVLERHLIACFRRAGFLSLPSLCQYPIPGSSMHYAGTLPMTENPVGNFQSDRYGRLPGTGRVRVVDGAALSVLPAKNHTFTVMANAMRIASHLRENRQ